LIDHNLELRADPLHSLKPLQLYQVGGDHRTERHKGHSRDNSGGSGKGILRVLEDNRIKKNRDTSARRDKYRQSREHLGTKSREHLQNKSREDFGKKYSATVEKHPKRGDNSSMESIKLTYKEWKALTEQREREKQHFRRVQEKKEVQKIHDNSARPLKSSLSPPKHPSDLKYLYHPHVKF